MRQLCNALNMLNFLLCINVLSHSFFAFKLDVSTIISVQFTYLEHEYRLYDIERAQLEVIDTFG